MFASFATPPLEQVPLSTHSPNPSSSPFPKSRQGHASVTIPSTASDLSLPPTVLVLGGSYQDTLLNDVWRSDNACRSWVRVEGGAPGSTAWCPRMNFGCVQAGGVIYVCGGLGDGEAFNDLWLSRDLGVTWECILGNIDFYCYEGSKGHFPSRAMFGFAYLPCDDVLLVYGGTDRIDNYNDVWSARRAALDEGFTLVRDGAKKKGGIMGIGGKKDMFSSRYGFWSLTMDDGVIFMGGGCDLSGSSFDDCWTSEGGSTGWKCVCKSMTGDKKVGIVYASAALVDNIIIVMGGSRQPHNGVDSLSLHGCYWSSSDSGFSWSVMFEEQFQRTSHTSVLCGREIVVMGGSDSNEDEIGRGEFKAPDQDVISIFKLGI